MTDLKNTAQQSTTRINETTFEQVYQLYWEKVYSVCYNNVREIETAKEMVQDIFKSLWERKNTLELKSVEHYLIRSAKLKTFEYIRNKVNRQKHLEINQQSVPYATNCTEEKIIFDNLSEKINLLINSLPNQCKKVFKMSREDGLTNKQIASALLISERAVEYHITRALRTLRSNISYCLLIISFFIYG